MKKLLVLSLASVMISIAATAQMDRMAKDTSYNTEKKFKGGLAKGQHNKGQIMKDLNLSKEQMSQMKTINQDAKTKMQALKADENITVKVMNERKKAIMDERKAKLKTILTPEQFAKLDAMKNNKMKGHKGKKNIRDKDEVMENI